MPRTTYPGLPAGVTTRRGKSVRGRPALHIDLDCQLGDSRVTTKAAVVLEVEALKALALKFWDEAQALEAGIPELRAVGDDR